jgi:hypothetical protein
MFKLFLRCIEDEIMEFPRTDAAATPAPVLNERDKNALLVNLLFSSDPISPLL